MNKLKMFKGKKFHFIGIGGISMSALAQMLKREGFYVQGSDEVAGDEIKKLLKKKIRVFVEHDRNNVLGVDVVVYTSAIQEDNPELVYARNNNLIILKRAELLGMISDNYKTVIAVAGSHGKTTATAMLSETFINAGLKPTVHIGGKLKSLGSNYKLGNKKYFITENCEYKDNFLFVNPDVSLILNIDSDHLDYFKSLDGIKNSFYNYAKQTKDGGLNIVFEGDENLNEIKNLDNSVCFGLNKNCDIYANNIREYKKGFYSFDAIFQSCKLGKIRLNIIGRHNVLNALACVFVSLICGIEFDVIKRSIETFSGVERRGDKIGMVNGVDVYHDYAHHPAQIKMMIESAKKLVCGKGRVITVFEPHTFSRTKYLLEDFALSLSDADEVILAPVYSARELESDGLTSLDLIEETTKYHSRVSYFKSYFEIIEYVKTIIKQGDLVLVLGAGNVEKLAKQLIKKENS